MMTKTAYLVTPLLLTSGLLCQRTPGSLGKTKGEAPRAPRAAFAWPVPGKVIVTETTLKKGRRVKMRYSLTITRERGKRIRLRYGDFAFLEVDGRDVTSKRWKRALAPSLAATSAIPDCIVNDKGDFVRVDGIDAMIKRLDKVLAGIRKETAAQARQRRAIFERPQFRQMMQTAMAGYWDVWVGKWIGWKVAPGRSLEGDVEFPIAGSKLRGKGKWTHHGPVAGMPGHVRLSFQSKAGGPELVAALQGIVTSLGAAPLGQMKNERSPADGTMMTRIEAITRLDDLRPAKVTTFKSIRIRESGQAKGKTSVEHHEYLFDWVSK